MSDPAHDARYLCHGDMLRVEIPGVHDGTCAYLCEVCQTWRHRFPRTDPRRAMVAEKMPVLIEAYLVGQRGDL